MLAARHFFSHGDATLIAVAALGALATLGVGLLNYVAGKRGRADIREAVAPTNGHESLGEGLAAIEDRLVAGDQRFDRIEVKLDEQGERFVEYVEHVAPLREWVAMKMEEEKE